MKDRILELAKEADMDTMWDFTPGFTRRLEKFYALAHQDGQRSMRERAAEMAVGTVRCFDSEYAECVGTNIRNLEITNE